MLEWLRKHKVIVVGTICLCFLVPLVIVHSLYQWDSHIGWLEAHTWDAGDVLSYISGCMTLLGTTILGIITVAQSKNAQEVNEKLSEESNRLQQIMAQSLYPVITVQDAKMFANEKFNRGSEFPAWVSKGEFTIQNIFGPKASPHSAFIISVNYDGQQQDFKYQKMIQFDICNTSDAIIRHVAFDCICIWNSKAQYVSFKNTKEGAGCSLLLQKGERIRGSLKIAFSDEDNRNGWDSQIGLTLYITNTTITGVKFVENIHLRISAFTNNYYTQYGTNTYEQDLEILQEREE